MATVNSWLTFAIAAMSCTELPDPVAAGKSKFWLHPPRRTRIPVYTANERHKVVDNGRVVLPSIKNTASKLL